MTEAHTHTKHHATLGTQLYPDSLLFWALYLHLHGCIPRDPPTASTGPRAPPQMEPLPPPWSLRLQTERMSVSRGRHSTS